MKKKLYEKPTMQVVMLNQQAQLLAGSAGGELFPMQDPEDL